MYRTFKKILALLTTSERRRICRLFAAILIMAFIEVAGAASIMPFMAVLASPELIESNRWLALVYQYGEFGSPNVFMMYLGLAVLLTLIFSNAFTALTIRSMFFFTRTIECSLSSRLVAHYAQRPYLFFVSRNSADLSKNVLTEVSQVVTCVISPAIEIVAKIVVCVFMLVLLVVVEPILAAAMVMLFGGIYVGLYSMVKRRLARSGQVRVNMNRRRYQVTAELFGGIKELMVLGREDDFISRYARAAKVFAATQADFQIISQLPRYALETLVFGGLLLIILYFLAFRGGVTHALPLMALYAMAGYRIMPAMQYIFRAMTQLRFYLPAVDVLYDDLMSHDRVTEPLYGKTGDKPFAFRHEIEVRNVRMTYPGASIPALNDISVKISKGSMVAFVGTTGSGKTTLVDVILGLLQPDVGEILVDGKPLVRECVHAWRNRIGYVPQQIFLADDTVERNIALGVPEGLIDSVAIERAARIANIHDLMTSFVKGYETVIGERGVRLSGGQRQRIGIARALYHDPDLLIMDEGTSALDGMTEEAVMEAIDNLAHEKTIILIAHRLTTVRKCDRIYHLEDGCAMSAGTYDELIASSEQFRAMAHITSLHKLDKNKEFSI